MKKLFKNLSLTKLGGVFSTASVGLLTLMLFSVANSASCFYVHEPKEPKGLDKYKWIK